MFLLRDLISPRTWLASIHHGIGLITGMLSFCVLLTGYVLGIGLLPLVLAGVPVLGVTQRIAAWFAGVERRRFGAVLGASVPDWPSDLRAGYRWGVVPRWRMLRDRSAWTEGVYGTLVRPMVSTVFATLNLAIWSIGLVLLTLPLYNRSLPDGGAVIDGTVLRGPLVATVAAVLGAGLLIAAPQVSRGLAVLDVLLTRRLLSPPPNLDLTVRVAELERSRERVVDAAEAERRRIERDLHDGAQQRLVALAMELGRAKSRFDSDMDGARALVDQAHEQAKAALAELRNLVRGVHPPVLTERGLDAALSGLAALCPLPVDVRVDVPVRPRQSIEAIAYFTVAEALTNVAKHARASHVSVVVEGHGFPGTLTVMITDDGIGGANSDGAGLTGLADRVAGVDGTMSVESPSGGPTIIAVELPCA